MPDTLFGFIATDTNAVFPSEKPAPQASSSGLLFSEAQSSTSYSAADSIVEDIGDSLMCMI